jgi:sulfate permease, SulP family
MRMGAKSRVVSIVAALICALTLLIGGGLVSVLPVALLSSLLLVLGLSFLIEWVYEAWYKLPRADYFIVIISLLVIAFWGYLEGVAVGVVMATIMFVVKYSSINNVRDSLNGKIYHAKVERPAVQREILHKYGEGIHIFRLQGYIFFGTSDKLLGRVREILEDTTNREHFIVLDFLRVYGLDSSAVSSFTRMYQLAELHDVYLVLTQAKPFIRQQLIQGGFKPSQRVQVFPTLDHGVEWCENMLLQRHEASTQFIQVGIKGQLSRTFGKPELVERLLTYLERMEVETNTTLFRRGDPSNTMYFVETGRLNVILEGESGEMTRLRNIRSGTVVGEISMYLRSPRTAHVVTEQKCVLYRLTLEHWVKWKRKTPKPHPHCMSGWRAYWQNAWQTTPAPSARCWIRYCGVRELAPASCGSKLPDSTKLRRNNDRRIGHDGNPHHGLALFGSGGLGQTQSKQTSRKLVHRNHHAVVFARKKWIDRLAGMGTKVNDRKPWLHPQCR